MRLPARPQRPASIYHAAGGRQSTASFVSTASAAVIAARTGDGGGGGDDKKAAAKDCTVTEGSELGISAVDSRYSSLNRQLLLCAMLAAVSSINYGWVIGSVNIPAQVIEQCSGGPETWTAGFPSCIPMGSTLWGLVVGLTPLGAWAGSMFSGLAADRFGRKRALMANNAFYVAGALLACTATSIAQLAVGRFVSGVGCGVAATVVSTYNSEVATVRSRGFLGGFQQLMILAGVFLSQVVSIGLSNAPLWRILFSISAAIAIVQTLLLLLFVPESPRYLASTCQLDETRAALQRLRPGLDITLELEALVASLESAARDSDAPQPTMWQVLTGRTEVDLRHLAFSALFLMVSQQWSGAKGVMFYSTEVLTVTFHLTSEEKKHIPTIAQLITLAVAGVGVLAVILGMNILDRVGRRTVLVVSSLLTTLSAALIVVGSHLDIGALVATAMCLFNFVFQAGAGFIPYLCASELLPYSVLGSISGLATSLNCLVLFIVSFTFPILDKALGAYLFTPFIATNLLTFLFAFFLMPEAKGKSIADVVDEYKGPLRFIGTPFSRRESAATIATAPSLDALPSPAKVGGTPQQ
ncbi:Bifunctional purine biosynthesis protein PurH [Coemansia javaensis]|uniref:Bifunctional purine biosynthesis protein PurH n=1 Tax=Coemansia javaensis TaxID=2761396 RepID=A0A9W8LG40_9FUNG|nr:Bifunctional purine biosynthesis protein PurH [Coemansia javaensis]